MCPKSNRKGHTQDQSVTDYAGVQELIDHEDSLVNYSRHIVKLITENTRNSKTKSVLEFGAGTGFLMELYFESTGEKPDGVEIDSNLIAKVKDRGFECHSNIGEINQKYEVIYTSNVLEHIEDDTNTLIKLHSLLSDQGQLFIYVPALPILFSQLDVNVGHYRRYTKKEILEKLANSNFTVNHVRYVDSVGVLAALLTKLLGYRNKVGLGSKKSIAIYDNLIFPISKMVDWVGAKKILGKNLFIVATPNKN